jgi:hypothetical protein
MDDRRFDDLLARLLDDALTPAEVDELAALLHERPDRQQRVREQLEAADLITQAEDDLRDGRRFVAAVLAQTAADPFVAKVAAKLPEARSRWWFWFGASAAGLLLTLGLAALLWPRYAPLARIAEVNGPVQWTGAGGRAESDALVGRPVGGGTLESLSVDSWAVVEYADGSVVTISGRSQLSVVDGRQKEVRLGAGRLSARVAPQPAGRPMLIHTPTALLEVVGTQVNVESDSSATRVSVNEGRVKVTRLVDGSVADVPADHQVVASVDRHSEFKAVRRPEPARVWQSRFPAGVNYGDWQTSADGPAELRAKALLLTCAKPKPLLIYVASAAVTAEDSSPLVLGDSGRFVVRGRLTGPAEVFFGMTMNHPKGGFAGKFYARRQFDGGGPFEWVIPLGEFVPQEPVFPPSPAGLELVECWCLTLHDDRGLAVRSIELQSDTR